MATTLTLVPAGAPATVEEQRARLPPAAECGDPVAGIWKSHSYDERHGDWTIFTLEIRRRMEGENAVPSLTQLEGRILNHTWYAGAEESQPGQCKGRLRYKVSMGAEGSVVDGKINFFGVGLWNLDEVLCGEWSMGYNLDHFSGTIDPEILEFQSVNNDGGRAVNDPTVFRRVQCLDSDTEEEPKVVVAPPPFYPPKEEGGCGVR
jgi:hypothetical protein